MSIWPSPRRGKEEDAEGGRKKKERMAAAGSHREEGAVFPLSENLERTQKGRAVKNASSIPKKSGISTSLGFITAPSRQLKQDTYCTSSCRISPSNSNALFDKLSLYECTSNS